MKLNRVLSIILCVLCITAFIAACIVMLPQAEDALAVPVLLAMMLPALLITAVTELAVLLTGKPLLERLGLLADVCGSFLMGGFWLLMLLQGGDRNLPWAIAVLLTNGITTVLLCIKMLIVRRMQ